MSTRTHCTLFLDTNALLHYPPLTQMKWEKLACGAQSVTLCLCITVIQQLDDKKGDPRLGDRARKRMKEVEGVMQAGGTVATDVTLELLGTDLRREDFPAGFSPDSSDDTILLHVKRYATEHSESVVKVVSEDLGMAVKCGSHEIPLVKPQAAGKRLPDPDSALTRKLSAALTELEKVKNTLPSLLVSICRRSESPKGNRASYTLEQVQPLDVETELARIRARYRRDTGQPAVNILESALRGVTTFAHSPEEHIRYNHEVDEYIRAYPEYISALDEYRAQQSRSIQMSFTLTNDGNAPAQDVDVHLHFPEGFELHGPDEFLKPPNEPKAPVRPRTQQEIMKSMLSGLSAVPRSFSLPNVGPPRNVSLPSIRKTNSYDVTYSVKNLKHGYESELGSLEVVYPSIREAKGFHIDCTCSAANLPQALKGKLHVIINEGPKSTE